MGCLHDAANVQQTSSECTQNTRAKAGRLLDVCSIDITYLLSGLDLGFEGHLPGLGFGLGDH